MNSMRRQQGLSFIGVAFLVFLIVFFGLLIVKMSGSYFDHFTLNKMIENSILEGRSATFSKAEFDDRLIKNMQINQIDVDIKKVLKHDKRSTPAKLVLEYENRVHLFANVDVVMTFYEEYEL